MSDWFERERRVIRSNTALSINEDYYLGSGVKTVPSRDVCKKCSNCGCVLNSYNNSDKCYSCGIKELNE